MYTTRATHASTLLCNQFMIAKQSAFVLGNAFMCFYVLLCRECKVTDAFFLNELFVILIHSIIISFDYYYYIHSIIGHEDYYST